MATISTRRSRQSSGGASAAPRDGQKHLVARGIGDEEALVHERLDGSGYPRALRAEQLDLETRVLAVCDVVDALISRRVYREAWSQDDALALLRREAVDDGLGTFPATDRRPELAHVGTR